MAGKKNKKRIDEENEKFRREIGQNYGLDDEEADEMTEDKRPEHNTDKKKK